MSFVHVGVDSSRKIYVFLYLLDTFRVMKLRIDIGCMHHARDTVYGSITSALLIPKI